MIKVKLMGGIGNHMFIYAFARAMSIEYGIPLELYDSQWKETKHGNDSYLSDLNITSEINIITIDEFKKYNKSMRTYIFRGICWIYKYFPAKYPRFTLKLTKTVQPLLNYINMAVVDAEFCRIRLCYPRKDFFGYGYFQSEKYFEKHKELIAKELRVKTEVSDKNKEILHQILKTESVCVHVRRGDYSGSCVSDICDEKYFIRGISLMKQTLPDAFFVVFSDDIEWVKKRIDISGNGIYVNQYNKAHEDLQLMYHCKHFIISNSSFSWWAQYLSDNQGKIVIAPKKWNRRDTVKDIYMDRWILI